MDQDDNQQMMQEILVEQPAQPVPQAEVSDNVVDVPPIHLLDKQNNSFNLDIHENDILNENEIRKAEIEQNMDSRQNQVI